MKPAGLAAGFWPGRFIACELVSQCVRMSVYVCEQCVCARVVGKLGPGWKRGSPNGVPFVQLVRRLEGIIYVRASHFFLFFMLAGDPRVTAEDVSGTRVYSYSRGGTDLSGWNRHTSDSRARKKCDGHFCQMLSSANRVMNSGRRSFDITYNQLPIGSRCSHYQFAHSLVPVTSSVRQPEYIP